MPNQRAAGVTVHNIGVEDALWEAAKAKAAREGVSVAEVTRRLLREWIAK